MEDGKRVVDAGKVMFGMDADADLFSKLAVDKNGRVLLCDEDREQLRRIERGIRWLIEHTGTVAVEGILRGQ